MRCRRAARSGRTEPGYTGAHHVALARTKAIIADDEPHLAQYLREQIAAVWPDLQIVATVGNGPEAAAAIAPERPDIAFLDIRMPGATGHGVARALTNDARPRVVFVTAYDQHVIDAFEADAVDYLLKPVTRERLAQTIEKLRRTTVPPVDVTRLLAELTRRLPASSGFLRWIRAGKRTADGEITHQIPVDEVVFIQADDKYTCVHSREGRAMVGWLIRVPLSELAQQLDPAESAQIHRSIIVNFNAVSGTRRDFAGKLYVRLRDQARELPVSRQYVHLFQRM